MKKCPMCKIEKSYSDYHKASKTKDGVQGHCKECKKILSKKYEKNRDKEKRKEYGKKQWEKRKNNAEYLKKHKQWVEDNKEYIKKKSKDYRESKGVLLVYLRSNQKAKNNGYFGKITMKEWESVLKQTNYMCIACEEELANTVDHVIPLSCGGTNTYDNIQPMCIRCNLKKGKRVVDFRTREFIETVKKECSE